MMIRVKWASSGRRILESRPVLAATPRTIGRSAVQKHVTTRARRSPTPLNVASWPGPNPNSSPRNEFQPPQDPAVASSQGVEGVIYPWNKGYQIWSAITTAAAAITGVVVPLQVALGVGSNS